MHIVVGDDKLRKLGAVIIPLLDVVDSGGFHQIDTWPVIQTSNELVIVVGKKKLTLNPHQCIPQTDMIRFCKAIFANVW